LILIFLLPPEGELDDVETFTKAIPDILQLCVGLDIFILGVQVLLWTICGEVDALKSIFEHKREAKSDRQAYKNYDREQKAKDELPADVFLIILPVDGVRLWRLADNQMIMAPKQKLQRYLATTVDGIFGCHVAVSK